MKRFTIRIGIVAWITLSLMGNEMENDLLDAEADSVQNLIQSLGSANYQEREEASIKLWEMNRRVIPNLEHAVRTGDPEVSLRASKLINYISIGILPKTSKEITLLVETYSKGDLASKRKVMKALSGKKEYRQMLSLLNSDSNKNHQLELWKENSRLGLLVARNSISKGRFDEALDVLESCPVTEKMLRARSFLLYRLGRVDSELSRIEKDQTLTKLQKYQRSEFLLKLKGELSKIEKHTLEEKDFGGFSSARLLQGDPLSGIKYLETIDENYSNERGVKNIKAYLDGQTPSMIAKINSTENLQGVIKVGSLMRTLFISGLQNEAEIRMGLMEPDLRFDYFEVLERTSEALSSIGILIEGKNRGESLEEWITEIHKNALKDGFDNYILHEQKLIKTAKFFHDRREFSIRDKLLDPYLNELEAEDLERWFNTIKRLRSYGMHEVAFDYCLEKGGDDNDFEELVETLFGVNPDIKTIWSKLQSRGGNVKANFLDLAFFMGYKEASDEYLNELYDQLVLSVKDEEKELVRLNFLSVLGSVSIQRNDLIDALKTYKLVANSKNINKNIKSFWINRYRNLSFDLMYWEDVVKANDLKNVDLESSSLNVAKLGISYRKLGRLKEGSKLIDLAITYSLLDLDELSQSKFDRIVETLYSSGYKDEAIAYWRQSLLVCDPGSFEFDHVLQRLNLSNHYISERNWNVSSSLYTMEAALNLWKKPNEARVNPTRLLIKSFNMLFTQGMDDLEQGRRKVGLAKLKHAHRMLKTNGILADEFFPVLIEVGLNKECETWVKESITELDKVIKEYPKSHNTLNTSAWILSRSLQNLDKARSYSERSLQLEPNQGAYLDTLAEVYFAMKDRDSAIKWSNKAVESVVNGDLRYGRSREAAIASYWDLKSRLTRFNSEPFQN